MPVWTVYCGEIDEFGNPPRSPTALHILTNDIYAEVNTAALKSAGRADFECSQMNCTVPCCTGACFSLLWDDGKSQGSRLFAWLCKAAMVLEKNITCPYEEEN